MPPQEPPEFPVVPLDGVTELRIHGVSGTPAEQMLADPHPVQVWGDPAAGFYRRPADGNDGTDHLEAYSWGRLTAGASARAAWLLLLPFMLINVASWAHPARRATRSRSVGTMSGAIRVLGLALTATLVLATAVLSMDLLAWQCAGAPVECGRRHWYTRWMTEGVFERPGVRIAMGAIVPVVLVSLIWRLSRSTTERYEQWGDERDLPERDPSLPHGVNDLSNPRFWQGRGPVSRLRSMHLAASLAFVAGLVAYAARDGWVGTALTVLCGVFVAAVAVVLFTPFAGRRRDLFEGRPPNAALCQAIVWTPRVAGLLLAAAAAYAVWGSERPAAGGPLPGLQGAKHVLVAGQFTMVAVLLVANHYAHRGRDRDDPDSVAGPLLSGYLASFLAILAVAIAGAFAAGLTMRVADYLGCPGECRERGRLAFVLPVEYGRTARSFAVAAALAVVAVLWFVLVARPRALRVARQNVVDEYPGHTDEARRRQIARVHAAALLTDSAIWPVAVVVAGAMAITGAMIPFEDTDVAAYATTAGVWLVGAFAVGLVVLGRTAYRNPATRRTVGIIWDLGTFWPRAAHPFAPPCYCERTVPELVERIEQVRAADGRVVVSAHSQGTVIAFAALLQFRNRADGLALVTYGSPLHRFYARAFPHFFGLPVLRYGRRMLRDRWVNLYRRSDPIGGPVTCADQDVPNDATAPIGGCPTRRSRGRRTRSRGRSCAGTPTTSTTRRSPRRSPRSRTACAPGSVTRTMRCPFCRHPDSRVVDSREADEGTAIRRRRECPECNRRFTTMETASLVVVKRNGTKEPFSRAKVVSGVRRACKGRPVDDDQLAALAQAVEDNVRSAGAAEVTSQDVGLAILGPLRELDEVAYLRFASVYRGFDSLQDFEREVAGLKATRNGDDPPPP